MNPLNRLFAHLSFVYMDSECKEWLENKRLIGLRVKGILIGMELRQNHPRYDEAQKLLREYRQLCLALPDTLRARMPTIGELETLYLVKDEINLALLMMNQPILQGKYFSSGRLSGAKGYLRIFDFERGCQVYNGITAKSENTEKVQVLPILALKNNV